MQLRSALPLALLLAACGGSTTPGGSSPTPHSTPKPDVVAHVDDLPQGVVRVQVETGSRRLLAHLDLSGLVPNSAHAVDLRRGSCLQRGGALLTAFTDARSGPAGSMSADVQAPPPAVALAGGEYVELYLVGAAQLAPGAIPIACADIAASTPTAAVRMTATPGFKPFGTIGLTYVASNRSGKLTMAVQALVGGTVHAVQILTGTCAAPGAVLHDAGDVTADSGGTVKATLTVPGLNGPPPASGWIVVVRTGAAAAIGTAAQPTAQAQPILCGAFAKSP